VLVVGQQAHLTSNNRKATDFLLIHESPLSKKRALRSSKDLDDEEAAALLVGLAGHLQDNDDEVGVSVAPVLEQRPSFKNGRRIQEPQPSSPCLSQKQKAPAEGPESPTGVDAFFGDLLSGQNTSQLLGL